MTGNRVKWMLRDKRTRRTMEQIVAEGMADASNSLNDAVETVVQTSVPAGGIASNTSWTYDNRTASIGEDTTLQIFAGTVYGGLIRVHERDKILASVGCKVTVAAADSTVAFALYRVNEEDTGQRGLAGALVADLGTISSAATGYKERDVYNQNIALDPGYYWVLVSPSATITINGFQSFAGHLGRGTHVDEVYSGFSDVQALPYPVSMDDGSRDAVAPLVYFELEDA